MSPPADIGSHRERDGVKNAVPSPRRERRAEAAFTLLELMIVLAIIGLLAALTLPAMKNVRQNNTMVSAGRQLVDDLSFARSKAISDQTKVFVVFIPSELYNQNFDLGTRDGKLGERLKSGLYTTYALYSERTVGDQPGMVRPRYLTSWRSLPDGVFISTNKIWNNPSLFGIVDEQNRAFDYSNFPFPTGTNVATQPLPYLAFDARGRLVDKKGNVLLNGEIIPLARGSILYLRDDSGRLVGEPDLRETPPGNSTDTNSFHIVRIDGLTGRARVETKALY